MPDDFDGDVVMIMMIILVEMVMIMMITLVEMVMIIMTILIVMVMIRIRLHKKIQPKGVILDKNTKRPD